jgi:hypothetical protein
MKIELVKGIKMNPRKKSEKNLLTRKSSTKNKFFLFTCKSNPNIKNLSKDILEKKNPLKKTKIYLNPTNLNSNSKLVIKKKVSINSKQGISLKTKQPLELLMKNLTEKKTNFTHLAINENNVKKNPKNDIFQSFPKNEFKKEKKKIIKINKSKDIKKSKKNIIIRCQSRHSPFRITDKNLFNNKNINLFLKKTDNSKSKKNYKHEKLKTIFSVEKSKTSTKPTLIKSFEKNRNQKRNLKDIFKNKKTVYLQKEIETIFNTLHSSDDNHFNNRSFLFPKNISTSNKNINESPQGRINKNLQNILKSDHNYSLVNPVIIKKMDRLKKKIMNLIINN